MQLLDKKPLTISSLCLPVRRADLDVNGHVNNGTYQTYFEEARIKAFESLSNGDETEILSYNRLLVLRSELDYKAELKYPDEVRITTQILESDLEATKILQEMFRVSDSTLVARAIFTVSLSYDEKAIYYSEENYQFSFYHPISVGWAEMTPEGNVDLATIQYYLDDARINSSIQSGLDLRALQKKGIGPVLYKADIRYFDHILFPDDLIITTTYEKTEKNRIAFKHDIFSKTSRKLLISSYVNGVFMDLKRKRPHQFAEEDIDKLMRTKRKSLFT